MKNSYRYLLMTSLFAVFYVIGCGSNNNSNQCQAGYQNVNNQCISTSQYLQNGGSCQGSCQVGQVQTSMGCLTASSQCGSCAAINPSTNQCVQAIQTGSTGYGVNGYGNTGYGTTGYPYGYGSSGYPYGYGSSGYGYGSYPYYH